MGVAGTINATPLVDWLRGCASNVSSQFGEDGLIDGCLQHIGETNRHCFEIGAADGRFFSNTLDLRNQGWFAVLIEANDEQYKKLNMEFGEESTCLHRRATDLDSVLLETDISLTPDVGIIDVDGQDWHLFDSLKLYRPRILLVEIHPPNHSEPIPVLGADAGQAGLAPITALATEKHYQLVAITHCNALFVDRAELLKD